MRGESGQEQVAPGECEDLGLGAVSEMLIARPSGGAKATVECVTQVQRTGRAECGGQSLCGVQSREAGEALQDSNTVPFKELISNSKRNNLWILDENLCIYMLSS